jgi:hypothetical protein
LAVRLHGGRDSRATGNGTRYRYVSKTKVAGPSVAEPPGFLHGLDRDLKKSSDMPAGQVQPFWDGNGRVARLLAHIPLLIRNLVRDAFEVQLKRR